MKRLLTKAVVACVITTGGHAHAQGIPVIDLQSIAQGLQQIIAWEQQYLQMVRQIEQQQELIRNATGSRQLGMILNTIVKPVLPPDIGQLISVVQNHESLNRLGAENFARLSTAMNTRASQIQMLMQQINATTDVKSIQELGARIQAEQVMATNEAKEAEWLRAQLQLQAQFIDMQHRQRMLGKRALEQ